MTRTRRTFSRIATAAVAVTACALATAQPAAADPLSDTNGFYVNTASNPATWVAAHPTDARAAAIRTQIAEQPIAAWFTTGSTGSQVASYVGKAASHGQLPVLVAYNIPGRDACGGQSGGGAGSVAAYKTWISTFAAAIADRPAVVVIEPDALGDFDCMSDAQIQDRLGMLTYATQMLKAKAPDTWAYLDAGNAGWTDAATMAGRLKGAGIANVRGFAVNVSNYYSTSASTTYANGVNAALGGGSHFVVDTSRNGNGKLAGEWCNPAGRKLGTRPQEGGGGDMLLWVKTPGNSDGQCGIAPDVPAGTFSPDLATRLINGT
ncbi:glycoside hydrolase family 6 protein [Streptomyces sp. NPDC001904]|uniref:glycoside hydrolase family 6 protein n=1 Tax=Streptomyces sp. NPDC001904 TaxID=3154531 RepID=UPI00332EAEFD